MRNNFIKYKITFAYTGILVIVLVAVMSGLAMFSEHHYEQEAKTELKDEISDFCKDMRRMDHVETNLFRLCFYDDGVTLSIYDGEGKLLAGLYPDDFPSIRLLRKSGSGKSAAGEGSGCFWIIWRSWRGRNIGSGDVIR